MEDMQPQASMEVVHNNINPGSDIEQESQSLQQEQASLEQQQETINNENKEEIVTKEVLIIRMEEIRLRIIEIEEEKKKKETILTKFLQRYKAIQNFIEDPVEQMKILISEKLLESLPEETVTEIKTNYEKYNFIDYKLVEEALETDEFSEELESLNLEQEQGQEQMETFEAQEQKVTEQIPETSSIETSEIENHSVLEELDGISGDESFNLDSNLEEAPFGGNPFEVIKGGAGENITEGLGDTAGNIAETLGSSTENFAEGLSNTAEGAGQALEAVGETVSAVADGLSNAA